MFNKVRRYKEYNKSGDVFLVVFFDEIGFVEVLKYNFFKVLYSLLELGDGVFFDVVVVGILNWVLDVVKMNRVIYLFRFELDVDDLFEIGKFLREVGSDKVGFGIFGICLGY